MKKKESFIKAKPQKKRGNLFEELRELKMFFEEASHDHLHNDDLAVAIKHNSEAKETK